MAVSVSGWTGRLLGTTLGRSAAGSVLTGFVAQACLVVSGVLAARILGVEGRGYLAMIVLFPILVIHLGSLGLPQAVTHYVARDRSQTRLIIARVRRLAMAQSGILTIVLAILLFAYTRGKPDDLLLGAAISLPVVIGGLAQQYGMALLLGSGGFREFNIWRAVPAVVYATLVLSIFVFDIGRLSVISAAWTVAVLVPGLLTLLVAVKFTDSLSGSDSAGRVPSTREMLGFGVKGMVGYISPLDSYRLDHLVAGLLLSPAALGIYVVGQAFTNLPKFLGQGVGRIVFPFVSAQTDVRAAVRSIRQSVLAVIVMNAVLIIPLILFMPVLVRFFFGEDFAASAPVARILLVGALFLSARRTLVEGQRGLGRPEVSTYAELIMYPALAISAPILIGRYGIVGLAWAVVVGHAVSFLYTLTVGLGRKQDVPRI